MLRLWNSHACNVANSKLSLNTVFVQLIAQGVIFIRQCSAHITNSTFDRNIGSLYTFYSNRTISGYIKFEECTAPLITRSTNAIIGQEGGAITNIRSTVIFSRKGIRFTFQITDEAFGGAILATESRVLMYGETTIANNVASNSGGGISLKKSRLEINGVCRVVNNSAVRGGGIHTSTSDIAVTKVATLQFISNNANFGGGSYLETVHIEE